MGNPLKVSLENIIPLTFARDHFSQIVSEVQQDKLFVLTKGGKPAVAIIDVKYLEDISGGHVQQKDINEEIKKDPEKVGLPPMVEHSSTPLGTSPATPLPRSDSLEGTRDKSGQVRTSPATPPKMNTPNPVPSSVTPNTPPKPAGFAAPRPPAQDAGVAGGPQPSQNPPMPKPTTPPPISKPVAPTPIPKPEPKPMPTPPSPIKPEPPKPNPPLVMPQAAPKPAEKIPPTPIPNKPLTTLPPVVKENPKSQVDVQFAPDESALQEKSEDGKIPDREKMAPDDETPPAQYAGEDKKEDEEPEDMALD